MQRHTTFFLTLSVNLYSAWYMLGFSCSDDLFREHKWNKYVTKVIEKINMLDILHLYLNGRVASSAVNG